VRFAQIRDGLSGTAFMAEILQGAEHDQRGVLWVTHSGGGAYMTRFTPNAFRDFYGLENDADRMNPIVCVDEPSAKLPCAPFHQSELDSFAGARSWHPGGVHVLFGDGSVRMVKDSISHPIWIALNSIRGNEAIGADQY
jgi:prepilin-type processing-associated H-X9-DG protein